MRVSSSDFILSHQRDIALWQKGLLERRRFERAKAEAREAALRKHMDGPVNKPRHIPMQLEHLIAPRTRMTKIKIQIGLLLDRAPWVGELRALRKKERKVGRDMAEGQRRLMNQVMKPMSPMYMGHKPEPKPPKLCSECGEPSCAFMPTKHIGIALYLHPFKWIWTTDKEKIQRAFDAHHKEYEYKQFCRTHRLALVNKYQGKNK